MKSWAVAKGPSFYPGDRRLAVQVEDHPMEYGGFEGIIPKGQYGGGTVMVWDEGTWWPQPGHENVDVGLREGSLKFEMHGSKMRGKWTLVRMGGTKAGASNGRWKNSGKPNWLLIKEHDELERSKDDPCITDEAPNSATTGRSLEEIARQEDHVWNSKLTAGTGQAWYRQDSTEPELATHILSATKAGDTQPAASKTEVPQLKKTLDTLPKETQPEFLDPQLAQETEAPPEGTGWLHELKLDGYRMQARKSARGVQMLTRSGLDWTYRVPSVADAVARLPVQSTTLDGEVVVLAADGTTNFADLQASFQQGTKNTLTFFCFDLLHIGDRNGGRNPRNLSLRERKQLLAQVLPADENSIVRFSEHLETGGGAMFEQACKLHAEGIVSKRADAPYHHGRNGDWLKAKCLHEQEFVIGGFTLSFDGTDRAGSLLLGYYETAKTGKQEVNKLIYAGRTGTGFTQKMRRDLRAQLSALETKTPAFAKLTAEARREAIWVKPELVAQVRFATWTADNHVRQAAFLGLREDKRPEEVVREEATAPPKPKGSGQTHKATRSSAVTQKPSPAGAPSFSVSTKSVGSGRQKGSDDSSIKPFTQATPPPIRLTHPTKILDPETGLTKQQLADYYWAVADRMLPHIADRPLSLVRCPEGAASPCFYQKHVNHMLPPGVGAVDVPEKKTGVLEPFITLSTPEALTGLAQMGVLEIHPWGSRNDDLEHPDRVIFDLDPDESLPWATVAKAALEVRARLKRIGIESFL
ncbi:MAG: DNA ligase D, partial [Pseudomonadota bacterium]|nr:DNA ligase D [Pseudomonadota bacterium]